MKNSDGEPDVYYVGTVQAITQTDEVDPFAIDSSVQQVELRLNAESDRDVVARYMDDRRTTADDLQVGQEVVVLRTDAIVGETNYIITDAYRLPSVLWLLGLFFLVAIVFAGRKGFTSLLGLGASLAVLMFYTVPSIVQGDSPFFVACISAFVIAILSITLAHGFSKQTGVALGSTLIALVLSLGLSQLFVTTAKLFGLGTEDAYTLSLAGLTDIDLRGLLLAGIIIGILGVLDDVTTAQTATIKSLAAAGVTGFTKLYEAGKGVGTEHIVSLVNTLALAYTGASLPLLLLFSLNEGQVPYWMILNSQMITEEVVRTLVGSTALVLAVPISTICAAWFYSRYPQAAREGKSHTH
jgi:uncharacterized membrane protein